MVSNVTVNRTLPLPNGVQRNCQAYCRRYQTVASLGPVSDDDAPGMAVASLGPVSDDNAPGMTVASLGPKCLTMTHLV